MVTFRRYGRRWVRVPEQKQYSAEFVDKVKITFPGEEALIDQLRGGEMESVRRFLQEKFLRRQDHGLFDEWLEITGHRF